MTRPFLYSAFLAAILIFTMSHRTIGQEQTTRPATGPAAGPAARDDAAAEKLGWRLGTQAWTFRDRSLFETIETAERLGLKYIELFEGQTLQKDNEVVTVGPSMAVADRDLLAEKLKKHGVCAVSFGVCHPTADEKSTRRIFDFAKALKLENISCEPDESALDLLEKLCVEYGINAAIHDHPKPSHYWNPETVLRCVGKRGKRLGACADTGHWKRSGLVPVDCLKMLEGRVIELHFKDIKNGEDQPWGTGDCDARGILNELHRQGFRGLINVEYETGSGAALEQNVTKCIEFFDRTAREILLRK